MLLILPFTRLLSPVLLILPFTRYVSLVRSGNNNAASSGVLKSVDRGRHWSKVNEGLFDTRIQGLFMLDDAGEHVLVGTPSGVFETVDGAASWAHVQQTSSWGVANSFRNGTINGRAFIFVGANGARAAK